MTFKIDYGQAEFRRDFVAALTVAAISLPQGMAYALLAGVDPRYGLYSAILVTAVASIFGSSSHLINGPTSAISLVVFSALSIFDSEQRVEAAEAMFLLGVMVGSIQIFIAVFRLGDLTRYISESVIIGFMSAAALLLAIGQIGNAFGLRERGTGSAACAPSAMADADGGRRDQLQGGHRHGGDAGAGGVVWRPRAPQKMAAVRHAGRSRHRRRRRLSRRLDDARP